jgi:hypothetical protein
LLRILNLTLELIIMINRTWNAIKPALLPLLLATYPTLFHYANNVVITLLPSLLRMLLLNSLLAISIYIAFLIFYKRQAVRAAIAAFVFLIFFNCYGILYNFLLELDIIQIEHYSMLPLFTLMAIYVSWLTAKINDSSLARFWTTAALILGILVAFNVIRIIPHELEKEQQTALADSVPVVSASLPNQAYPDIYYIVLDEFSGFEPMRQYWNFQGVDDFKQFLENKGFFVAEQSHGASTVTLYELATRLNYRDYPCCNNVRIYFAAIANNQVARYLKTEGYTTVTFDESESVFPADLPMQTDYSYSRAPDSTPSSALLDDFGILVINNTMLRAFSNIYEPSIVVPAVKAHKDMLFFTLDKMKDLNEVSSPKFVYVHLLLPHMPFIFDKNGVVITTTYNTNWNDYLGNYIFSINYAEKMIDNILSQADPKRPPIIILQSDHGARNQIYYGNEETLLKDFPEEFKTSILFALYMPGYDTSGLPQDINPINTFPIVFNHLFNADIPLVK